MQRIKKLTGNKGFTIIELIVVLAITVIALSITVAGVTTLLNKDSKIEERSRSMYFSLQTLMSNVKLTGLLPKNSDGGIKIMKADGDEFSTANKYYFIEVKVTYGQIESFRIMVCSAGYLEAALNEEGNEFGDADYFVQIENEAINNNVNKTNNNVWNTMKSKIETLVENDDNEISQYYIAVIDSAFRVDRVYYSPAPLTDIRGEQFDEDGFIEGIGNIGAFPLSMSQKGAMVTFA